MATSKDLDPAGPYGAAIAQVKKLVPRNFCNLQTVEDLWELLLLDLHFEVWDQDGCLLLGRGYMLTLNALVIADDDIERLVYDDDTDAWEIMTKVPFPVKLELDPRWINQQEWSRRDPGVPQALRGRTIRVRIMNQEEMAHYGLPYMMTVHADGSPVVLPPAR